MINNTDIEIQADFNEIFEGSNILRAIHLRQKRYNFKNPLETLKSYRERFMRDFKKKNLLTESISIPKRSFDIKISGKRCVSVDIRKMNSFEKNQNFFSSTKISQKPKLLPKLIRNGLISINNQIVL